MSSCVHANNRTKSILILGEGFTHGLEDTTLYAGKKYPINFSAAKKRFCLSLHYDGVNNYLFVNGTEVIKFKAKDYGELFIILALIIILLQLMIY